ncbi:MAG: 2'-5' RNA ligase family protein [Coriobacteriales bacterium]|jgi:2'-5' RNA ligase|nr:2'-5' RNA ligase family protein [Coriobacteriales bacterium]
MRLFVAIGFPDAVKDALAGVAHSLARQSDAGRFVPRENFHLTLAFIGETGRVNDVREVVEHVAWRYLAAPLELRLAGIGSFRDKGKAGRDRSSRSDRDRSSRSDAGASGDGRHGRSSSPASHTWWVGVVENPALLQIATVLNTELREAGFSIERRNFKPHITLGRGVVARRPVELAAPDISLAVGGLSLIKSDLSSGRPIYTELFRTAAE